GCAESVARKDLCSLHHLFLVDEHAIGFARDWLQKRMLIFDFHLGMAAADEIRNEVHWAWPIQSDKRCDMLNRTNLEFSAEVAHAAGFKLEYANGVATIENVVSFLVI